MEAMLRIFNADWRWIEGAKSKKFFGLILDPHIINKRIFDLQKFDNLFLLYFISAEGPFTTFPPIFHLK